MATAYQIPLRPSNPTMFSTTLDGAVYRLRMTYDTAQDVGCWILDIADSDSKGLVYGIAMVSGVDLLAQYRHLGFAGGLWVTTDRGAGEVPGFADFGSTARLFYVSDS